MRPGVVRGRLGDEPLKPRCAERTGTIGVRLRMSRVQIWATSGDAGGDESRLANISLEMELFCLFPRIISVLEYFKF